MRFTIVLTRSAIISTGDVMIIIHNQSCAYNGETLNILPANVTIRICPTTITKEIQMNPALNDSLTLRGLRNRSMMSFRRQAARLRLPSFSTERDILTNKYYYTDSTHFYKRWAKRMLKR